MPLCYWWFQEGDFFYDELKVTTLFLELFSLTLIHGATVCLTAVSMSTVHGADLPTFCVIIWVPFLVPPSCIWQKTEWATLINSCLATSPSALVCNILSWFGLFYPPSMDPPLILNVFPQLHRDGHHGRWCALRGSFFKASGFFSHIK